MDGKVNIKIYIRNSIAKPNKQTKNPRTKTQKPNNSIQKWATALNRHFPKKTYKWSIYKMMFNITNQQGNVNQTTMKHLLKPITMFIT